MAWMAGAGGSYARCHEKVGRNDSMKAETSALDMTCTLGVFIRYNQ